MPSKKSRKIWNIVERAKVGKERGNFLKTLSDELLQERDDFYSRCRKARENASLGFSAPYEERVPQIARIYYEAFEDSMRIQFGKDVATYYSLMIFHNVYMDLKELGWKLQDPKTKRSDFNYFMYGRPGYVIRKEWRVSFSGSFAYALLFDGEPDWKQQAGEVLAMNTEACTTIILSSIESGTFFQIYDFVEETVGNAYRFGVLYTSTRTQMKQLDLKMIGAGEPPYFRLPLFGV